MSRLPFKEALSSNLDAFYSNMNGKMLQADIHSVLMTIEDSEELEEEQVRAIKYVLQNSVELYHICNRNQEEFNNMITFLHPKTEE